MRQADDDRWYWASENFPASEISLRVGRARERRHHRHRARRGRASSARSTCSRRAMLVHENAIYLHESRQYHVDRLDWEERKAYVRPVDVDYYTQAELAVTLKPLEMFDAAAPAGARTARSTAR